VGFDDDPYADYLPVPLTTIRQPRGEAGEAAFNLLLKQLQGGTAPSAADVEQVVLQPKLVPRASTVGLSAAPDSPGAVPPQV
ncbi:MAG TPA: substrate-binding domain-containing protein, partial [Gemmatimonadaceae bacterium]